MGNAESERNQEYAKAFKEILDLRYDPVAVRIIREDDDIPSGFERPPKQMSYCQAVTRAKHGEVILFTPEVSECNVGASALGLVLTPDKVRSGEFHYNIGAHSDQAAVARMIEARAEFPQRTKGAIVAPLGKADFDPDVVIFEDIPERIYWFVPLSTAEEGGRAYFSTAPFQAACVDTTTVPVTTGRPNISLGCFGCRKRTDIRKDELLIGVPWAQIPGMRRMLDRYREGILTKAKRD